ncbi:hypothetical protein [Fodinibius sp.]|uniref:hypothetical protein n=1 Tax=Fodinibius sp. TaxID=1872440 RepID=UPI003562D7F3
MDIFKLFFDHDLRLDKLAKRNANKTPEEVDATLADFMKPTPTYSKFYLTGTRLEEEQFGLNTLVKGDAVIQQMSNAFSHDITTAAGTYDSLSTALAATGIGEPLIIGSETESVDFDRLRIDEESNVGHKKEALSKVLKNGIYVLYKEQAHHGFDLHLFSIENIYPSLFRAFQSLVDNDFRFFSINSKRMRSERHFYFETWTLDRPPHGAEEVFPDTVL